MVIRARGLAGMALAVWLAACSAGAATSGSPTPVSPPAEAVATPSIVATPSALRPSEGFAVAHITLADGAEQVQMPVFVADTPALRRRGLMEREELQENAGMLFVFDEPTDSGFWMKNTLIPLSIAFIGDDRQVLEVFDMDPCDTDPCPVQRPRAEYRYALEVNRGFFEQHGIHPGWRFTDT